MKLNFVLCFALLLATGCGDHKHPTVQEENITAVKFTPPVVKEADVVIDEPVGESNVADKVYADADYRPSPTKVVQDTSKKIVKEGSIEFEADNLTATRKKIISALKKCNGYIDEDNQTINGEEGRKEFTLKIRIPAAYFDGFLDSVSSTADKIDSKNISITDVTTRYIDIKTRLANKLILEKRYLELLNKGSKISDLLEIENKLTQIRSDIESTQGQLNYLTKQVAYSSLNITFYTKQSKQVNAGDGMVYKFKTAIADGWLILQNLFFGVIGLWPLVILIGALYFIVKRWRKRRKEKQQS